MRKDNLPRVDPTLILQLEWYLAHKKQNPSTTAEIIPELESQIKCDSIRLHERNVTTPEALGKTFGDLTIEELSGICPNVPPKIPIVPKSNAKIHTTEEIIIPQHHPVVAQPKCQLYTFAKRLSRCKSARLQRKFRARLAKHERTTFKEARGTTTKPRARRKRENNKVRTKDEGRTIRKNK